MPDLLLEVLSEEIPARMQEDGAGALVNHVLSRLLKAQLADTHIEAEYFYTPRRLAMRVQDLPAEQRDITVERKGPRVDAPQKAIEGFLKSTGLTLENCEQRETPKGPVWVAVMQEKGRRTRDLLSDLLPEALAAVRWPKSMRWEESGARWVRPIRSILCLLDDEVVPLRFGSVESGRTTYGHRFLFPDPRTIEHASGYEATLQSAKVMLDPDERQEKIVEDAKALAKREGLSLVEDEWLETENADLVEWPVVLMGRIDERFMDLPPEVLRSAMRTHQRYFASVDSDGRPAPRFVMVANTETADGSAAIRTGNERVLRARLADARFFWEQDQRRSLEDRVDDLDGVVFHARLGSMKDKAERIAKLAPNLCPSMDLADAEMAERAGRLCKTDLVTEMVGEFPDLQGIMGSYYARDTKEPMAVYQAIREHYAPQGPSGACPTAPVSVAVALADKLDTLAGFFAIDERPTGSKDPFALRRAALGVIRLIVETEPDRPDWPPPLGEALDSALAGYGDLLPKELRKEVTRNTLLAFFTDRQRVYLRDQDKRHDHISAVFAVAGGENNLVHRPKRVEALEGFLDTENGKNLLTAYRRAANILRMEEKKDSRRYEGEPDTSLFDQDEERTLYDRIDKTRTNVDAALRAEVFEQAMDLMATLRDPVDAFFDNVTVNSDDPELRYNRLLMLSQIRATLDRVADFSKIEG